MVKQSFSDQMNELIKDIGGTFLNYVRHRHPTATHCPNIIVKLFSIIPGLGHMFIGFYTRGILWLIITLPVIAAFIYVVVDVGFINLHTLEAIGGMYLILVIFCLRDISHLIKDVCGNERSIAYFKRRKAAEEQYNQIINRHYTINQDGNNGEIPPPNSDIQKNQKGEWR
jgi:hypothetical protein